MSEFDSPGHFGELANTYDASAFDESAGLRALSEREIAIVVNSLQNPRFEAVLDVGIGTGRMAGPLTQLGKSVTGLDITSEMLAEASRACPMASILQAKFGNLLPFRNDSFDAVLCVRVLKYVDDWNVALSEIARVLRSEGRAVLEIANRRSVARWGYAELPVRLSTFGELRTIVASHSFAITEVWRGSRAPFPLYRSIGREESARRVEVLERFFDRIFGQTALARSFFVVLDAN